MRGSESLEIISTRIYLYYNLLVFRLWAVRTEVDVDCDSKVWDQ